MGTFFQAYGQADFFGKLIFFSLFLLSCISWIFLLQKFLMMKHIKAFSKSFKKLALLNKEQLLKLSSKSESPLSIVYNALKKQALIVLDKNHYFSKQEQNYLSKADIDFLDSHLQITIAKLKAKIEKNCFILPTTIALAPFLGLLGTVWGILISFKDLQTGGHVTSSNTAILGGLSTALTTTILGLLIAIPALIGNNYLRSLSKHFTLEMIDFSHFLLSTI